ncbi:uncharacterized protein LOC142609287 [Castanea sativa]|uniref:uncharacterized protein LOC142609287 n=1 Tax=Castanea sativa TaxID=21020 RepID=UPI003F64EC72
MEGATVYCLIDENSRQWNSKLVDGIFIPGEAELVKKIPIARIEIEDSLFWPFSANGHYNCKLGYRFLKELDVDTDEDAQPDWDKKLWKGIWSLEIPIKYKNLVWRACRNSLSTKMNLTRRTIIDNPTCEQCSSDMEDSLHAL